MIDEGSTPQSPRSTHADSQREGDGANVVSKPVLESSEDVAKPSRCRRSLKAHWQLGDLIDFEYLLENDRGMNAAALAERDHTLYRRIMETKGESGSTKPAWNRRWLFRRWLELRRERLCGDEQLPGGVFTSAWRLIYEILAVIGVLLGAGLAANLLRYDGVQPVNVAAFLGWLVLAQLALVIAAGGVFLLRRIGCLFREFAFLTGLMRWAWSWLAVGLSRHALHRLPAERRLEIRAFLGRIASRRSLFGEVAVWPLAGLLQWFGICFNVGAIVTTILLVVFSDRAFGWQSAVDFNSIQIHAFVREMAYPWTWFYPGGVPSLEQVMGSKIVLKNGIKQLATENLVSWWPFLCLALVTYGLMPRIALWIIASILGSGARRRIAFRHVACDRLYERMTAPVMSTAGLRTDDLPGPTPARSDEIIPRYGTGDADKICVPQIGLLLISEDWAEALGSDIEALKQRFEARFPWRIRDVRTWPVDHAEQADVLREIKDTLPGDSGDTGIDGVMVLEEAWQPPIAEKLEMLRALRVVLGVDCRLVVVLVGRPHGKETFTIPTPVELRIWERHVSSLGDARLRIEPWVAL